MAIQDSDPERRNLMVTSIAFIVFYLADGQISQDAIRLQVIPVTFNNVIFLNVFVWVMLCWFGLRYWQTHRASYKNAYQSHLNNFGNSNEAIARYIEKANNIPRFNENNGFREHVLRWYGSGPRLHVEYKLVQEFTKNQDGSISVHKQENIHPQPLTGYYGWLLKTKYFLSFSVGTPGFTSYAAPYILFITAMLVPALKINGFIE